MSMSLSTGTPPQSLLSILIHGLQTATSPKTPRRGRPPKQQIRHEANGWGSTVAPGVRYYYVSRTRAREGKPTDEVGQNGRVA